MEIFRRTVYGAAIQTAQVLGIELPQLAHTTLNEALAINASATLGTNEIPRMKYITLGIGGHRGRIDSDGITLIENIQHKASDANHYRMLPLVVRPLNNDLTTAEMGKYALRKIKSHSGVDYAMYHAMRFDTTGVQIKYKKKVVANGHATISDFVPDSSVLTPVAPATSPGANTVDGTYLYCVATVNIELDAFTVGEILNSARILYGSERYAFISELGFVTGVDRTMQSQGSAGSFNMNEVINAQVFTHVSVMQPLYDQTGGVTLTYDVGISEPIMAMTGP